MRKLKGMQKQSSDLYGAMDDPSKASHQRQMNLKLSEIFDRMRQNQAVEVMLVELLQDKHVSAVSLETSYSK